MNVLLDTNILTRWVNAEDSQHSEAVECLRRLRTSGHIPTIVPQNLYEFWVVATRPIAVNGLGMTSGDAKTELRRFGPPLMDSRYGRPRTFATLAMLYPGLDLTQAFHVDHIFPRSLFTRSKLAKARIPSDRLDTYLDAADSLPNLQLLPGIPNIEKQAALPYDWLAGPHFPNSEKRERYIEQNDLQGLPLDLVHFLDFHAARRELMASRLRAVVGAKTPTLGVPP